MQKQNLIKMSTSVRRDRSTDNVSLFFLKIIKKEAKRRFFISFAARKNGHKFPNDYEERTHLIYKYPAKYTAEYTVFEQCYEFDI
jgi:hypothetical protein